MRYPQCRRFKKHPFAPRFILQLHPDPAPLCPHCAPNPWSTRKATVLRGPGAPPTVKIMAENLYSFSKSCFFCGFLVVFKIVFFIVFSWFSKYGFLKTMKRLANTPILKHMKRLWEAYQKTISSQRTTKKPGFAKIVQTLSYIFTTMSLMAWFWRLHWSSWPSYWRVVKHPNTSKLSCAWICLSFSCACHVRVCRTWVSKMCAGFDL